MDDKTKLVVRALKEQAEESLAAAELCDEEVDRDDAAAEFREEAHALEQVADDLESVRLRLVEVEP